MANSQTDTGSADGAAIPVGGLLRKQIAVSVIINLAFNWFFAWLLFSHGRPIELWGTGGVAFDVLPATVFPALMMTLAVTTIMRGRLRNGMMVVGAEGWPLTLPRQLAVRTLTIILLTLALVTLPVIGLLALLWNGPWTLGELLAFKVGLSIWHAAVVTPIVVLAAVQMDGPRG